MKNLIILITILFSPPLYGAEQQNDIFSGLSPLPGLPQELYQELGISLEHITHSSTPPSSPAQPCHTPSALPAPPEMLTRQQFTHLEQCFTQRHFTLADAQLFRRFIDLYPNEILKKTSDGNCILHIAILLNSQELFDCALSIVRDYNISLCPCSELYDAIDRSDVLQALHYVNDFLGGKHKNVSGNINHEGLTPCGLAIKHAYYSFALTLHEQGCKELPPLLAALSKPACSDMNIIIHALLNYSNKTINPNIKTPTGDSALHLAIKNGYQCHVISYLLEQGASVEAQDSSGRTPIELAQALGRDDIVRYIHLYQNTLSKLPFFTSK